ncbi:hypothetical protein BGW80DRAFT_1283464 [Lactifluus volemus]|nr:hypothetical protein BGW80DRAFT_1283464 [Lactifluus volemus]
MGAMLMRLTVVNVFVTQLLHFIHWSSKHFSMILSIILLCHCYIACKLQSKSDET